MNILIGGEAGQGLVTVGELLSNVLVRAGYNIVVTQSYQSRIRGGHNTFSIRVSDKKILAPKEDIDILVALNKESIEIHKKTLSKNALIIGPEKLASFKAENVAALGIVASLLGIGKEIADSLLKERFGKKGAPVIKENEDVLISSYAFAETEHSSFPRLPKPAKRNEQVMMNGNEAIALGAISAGLKFASFYPMTPSTSVNLSLIANARKNGIIVEQAEDEIAAINMAIGASYAGAPSMVATSGGGFALMVEGVSLAGMTETPLVIVVAQRPGPATGLPTRTEQADLEFVLYSGHGEFPRAIFAPGSVEECFHLTRKAFELAERYQGPVFILTDQFLADSYRNIERFKDDLRKVSTGASENEVKTPYLRYRLTEDGISPRLIPGASRHLVIAGSDEHTEDGHLTEDLEIRVKMADKRLKKMAGLVKEVTPPSYFGDNDPQTLFVTFGSTIGSALEVVNGTKGTALLNFSQVWPMVPAHFMPRLNKAKNVISVEGNATGQLANLIRRVSGFEISRKILRYDGLPITPEYILRKLD